MTDRLRITLAGMRFHARVGILPHERELPQPLEVDVEAWRASDALDVLDYRALYAATADVVGGDAPLLYLEEIASRIADGALALGGVARVRVAVRKPHVALAGPLAYAEIALERAARASTVAAGRDG